MAEKVTAELLIDEQSFIQAAKIIDSSLEKAKKSASELEKSYEQVGKAITDNNKEIVKSFQAYQIELKKSDAADSKQQKGIKETIKELDNLSDAYKKNAKAQEAVQEGTEEATNTIASFEKQLKEIRKEAKGIDVTSDKFKQLAKDAAALDARIKESNKAFRQQKQVAQAAAGSYDALNRETNELRKQLRALPNGLKATSAEAQRLKNNIAANTEQLKAFDAEIGQNFRSVGGYKDAINEALQESGLFTNEIQRGSKALSIFNTLFKSNTEASATNAAQTNRTNVVTKAYDATIGKLVKGLKNSVVAQKAAAAATKAFNSTITKASAIGILVTALAALGSFFTRSQGGIDRINKAFAQLNAFVAIFLDRFSKLGEAITLFFEGEFSAAAESARKAFEGINDEISKEISLTGQLSDAQAKLNKDRIDFITEEATQQRKISILREQLERDREKDTLKAIAAIKEVIKINNELQKTQESLLLRQLQIELALESEEAARERLNQIINDGNELKVEELGLADSTLADLEETNNLVKQIIETQTANNLVNKERIATLNTLTKAYQNQQKAIADATKEEEENTDVNQEATEVLEVLKIETQAQTDAQNELNKAYADGVKLLDDFAKSEEESVDVFTEDKDQDTFITKLLEEAQAAQAILNELAGDNETIRRLLQIAQLVNTVGNASRSRDAAASEGGTALGSLLAGAFWTGTKSSPEGLALVGEKGAEIYRKPSGEIGIYDSPQVANLTAGTRIWDANDTKRILENMAAPIPSVANSVSNSFNIDYDRLSSAIAEKYPTMAFEDLGEHMAVTKQHLSKVTKTIYKTPHKLVKGL